MGILQRYQWYLRYPSRFLGNSLLAKVGRQGKSLAVRPAYVAGIIEVFTERPNIPASRVVQNVNDINDPSAIRSA
jgi:hypothetical protein